VLGEETLVMACRDDKGKKLDRSIPHLKETIKKKGEKRGSL